MEYKQNRRSSYSIGIGGIMMRIAAVLLCLVLISLHLMSGLYAKYSATGRGEDDARVAKFDVVVTGQADDVQILCSETPDTSAYTITVVNSSEVAVHYDMNVTYNTVPGVGYTFEGSSGDLAVGGTSTPAVLSFAVSDWDAFTAAATGNSVEMTLDFTVTVHIVQID